MIYWIENSQYKLQLPIIYQSINYFFKIFFQWDMQKYIFDNNKLCSEMKKMQLSSQCHQRLSPLALLQMASLPKHPRRCLRSGQGVPPFLGGTDTRRLLSVLPTPQGDVQEDQGPQDPTTQSMAAGEAGRQEQTLEGNPWARNSRWLDV